MDDKQLNINQPLLSVRRVSSIAAPQKNENRRNPSYLATMRPIEFKPGPMKNTGSVPFVWEHSPGRPKDETNKHIQTTPTLPKLPPGWIIKPKKKELDNTTRDACVPKDPPKNHSFSHKVLPTQDLMSKFERAKSEKESSDSDDDNNEAYMDALDTLSRGESSFYNCSASGISGLESDAKPSGVLSADPKVRDFMMGRFLPAAKAMASEVPQHTSRKHHVKEKPREVKKLANLENKKVLLRYGPTFLEDVGPDTEEEDSDYDYDEHGNTSSKLCGLLPRLCGKGSGGLVNPVSGMSMRTRLPIYPANRTHASSSSISSFSETENERARIGIYEHRSFDKSVLKSESIEAMKQNNSWKLEGLGLYKRLQGTEPASGSLKKGATSFKELLANENKNGTDGQASMAEKTLYVDTVHTVNSPEAYSQPSDNLKADDKKTHKCESFESDDMKTKETNKGSWKDPEVDMEGIGDEKLKGGKDGVLELPAPPPLPKSPSDSWLWRTLPSVSSKPAPAAARWNPSSNTFATDTKSDNNIKSGYPQGPLFRIPET